MEDIYITFRDLKEHGKGFVFKSEKGFNICINNQLEKEEQIETLIHELHHSFYDFNDFKDVQVIEHLARTRTKEKA